MVCFIYTVTVGTTSPQDISSTLNAIPPPPIQGGGGGGGGVCGNAGELIWNNASTCSSTTGMTWTSSIQYLNNPTGSISASFISGQNVGTGGGYLDTFAWNPANGLPSHSVACIGAAGTAIVCPVNTTSWSGIVVSTSVSMGIATVVASGNAQCQFDGAATVGDIAQTSTVTAGYCHDSGSGSLPVLSGGVAIGPIVASTGSLATVLMAGSAVPYPGVSSNGSGGLSVPAGTVSAQTVSAQTVTGQTVTAQAVVGNTVGGLRYAAPYGGLPPAQALNQTVFSTMDDIYTNQPSSITSWSITSNVATFQAVNSYVAGQNIQLHDFNSAAAGFFNQQFVNVVSATPTQFTVSFTHANASGSDTGSATLSNSYSFQNGYPPNLPNASHWTDLRRGKTQNQYFNWGFEAFKNTFSGFPAAESTNCVQWLPFYGAFSNGTGACHQMTFIDSSPGVSIGNPGVGANPALNWLSMLGNVVNMTSYGAGIREANGSYFTHYGIGDTANYWYINSHGGAKATSDEGTEAAIRITEDMAQATGSCQVGCAPYTSTGSNPNQQIKLIYTGAGTANGGTQGVGRPIIDLTQSPISTTYTNATTGLDGTMQALTIAASVPVSNAWGKLVANVQPNWADMQNPPNYGTLLSFQVNSITGGFVTGVPLCIASEFNDNVVPITVTGSGTVTITAIVSRPHVGGAWVFQGGMCR